MDKKNFEKLLKGAREAGEIVRGEMSPARVSTTAPAADVEALKPATDMEDADPA